MDKEKKISMLRKTIQGIYSKHRRLLPFHGWHHIVFVSKKATEFAQSINADLFLVESAAIVHDLNYITKTSSNPEAGAEVRNKYLDESGYDGSEILRIEEIVIESHTAYRSEYISAEGKALSDADTLFKALPITPIVFASKYVFETETSIYELATKIATEQNKLMNSGIYFYTEIAQKSYLGWAKTNLCLWNNVLAAMQDKDILEMVRIAQSIGVIDDTILKDSTT